MSRPFPAKGKKYKNEYLLVFVSNTARRTSVDARWAPPDAAVPAAWSYRLTVALIRRVAYHVHFIWNILCQLLTLVQNNSKNLSQKNI